MFFKSIVLAALLIASPAFATEGPSEIVWGGGGCTTQYMFAKFSEGAVTTSGTDQAIYELCFPASVPNGIGDATPSSDATCMFPNGIKVTIRDIWYTVWSQMGTLEQCKIGLTTELTGGEPFEFEAWSIADFGTNVSILSTCDVSLDHNSDGFLDDIGDTCHVHDSVGTVLTAPGTTNTGFKILIDEASSGVPTCTNIAGLKIALKLEICDMAIE